MDEKGREFCRGSQWTAEQMDIMAAAEAQIYEICRIKEAPLPRQISEEESSARKIWREMAIGQANLDIIQQSMDREFNRMKNGWYFEIFGPAVWRSGRTGFPVLRMT